MHRSGADDRLHERDGGFTLVELLVVVIILGVLAAIAVPVYLSQRQQAWTAAVESDVRNAAIALETFHGHTGHYDVSVNGGGPPGTPPGQGGTPPGQGGTPPGQGGTPPGQAGGADDLTEFGLVSSPGVELRFYTDGEGNDHQSYCIEGLHESIGDDPVRVLLSTDGTFVDADTCPDGADSYAASYAAGS